MTVAALYVEPRGPYAGLPDVDVWDRARDARLYNGPYPVVAHPPCERWGRYWFGGPSAAVPRVKGDDGGCFATALDAVRRFGGVLEHPARSAAWRAFNLRRPPRAGGWISADWRGGFTCCVDQGHYGHRAQKATWLYACGVTLPSLVWGQSPRPADIVAAMAAAEGTDARARVRRTGMCQQLSKRQRAATPLPFRDLLLSIARARREA